MNLGGCISHNLHHAAGWAPSGKETGVSLSAGAHLDWLRALLTRREVMSTIWIMRS